MAFNEKAWRETRLIKACSELAKGWKNSKKVIEEARDHFLSKDNAFDWLHWCEFMGRDALVEEKLLKKGQPLSCRAYAVQVMEKRWPEAEKIIFSRAEDACKYLFHFWMQVPNDFQRPPEDLEDAFIEQAARECNVSVVREYLGFLVGYLGLEQYYESNPRVKKLLLEIGEGKKPTILLRRIPGHN